MNAKVLEKKFIVPFVLITSLFALWGFANDITNPMVAVFQTVMEIPASEAALVQLAFYGGYGTMAIPAALFASRYSYKAGILLGLALYAIGAFLFWPAAQYEIFNFFSLPLYFNLWARFFGNHCQSLYSRNGRSSNSYSTFKFRTII